MTSPPASHARNPKRTLLSARIQMERTGLITARMTAIFSNQIDTLPVFRKTLYDAGLEDVVVALVGDGPSVARNWATPLSFLFIDGGHGVEPARLDYELWTPHVAPGGLLAIHDVFTDPAEGGQAPHDQIYAPALASGLFADVSTTGSLRILRRRRSA